MTTAAGRPPSGTAVPGPDAAPFRWEHDVHPLFTRETARLFAPTAILLVGFLAVITVVMAVAVPSSAGMFILVTLAVIVAIPLIIWAALAFGNLQYGRPKPTAWEVGPFGIRRVTRRGEPAMPGALITALEAMDVLGGDLTSRPPEESVADLAWADIVGARFDDQRHVVEVRTAHGSGIPCYCGSSEWPTVVAWVRWGLEAGSVARSRS